jgi:hypothetical protein
MEVVRLHNLMNIKPKISYGCCSSQRLMFDISTH